MSYIHQARFVSKHDPVLNSALQAERAMKNMRVSAAADFLGPGAVEIPKFETEILDILRREFVELNRFKHVPATGAPHRYFEQTAYSTGQFSDPRNLVPTPSSPTRVERSAVIKALINQTNITHFDKEVTAQQGQFEYVTAKDITDVITGILKVSAGAVWTGTDTSLITPTTDQYVGLLTQITLTSTILPGASIVDGLKRQVATMVASQTFMPKPTVIYANPLGLDYLDQEAKAQQVTFGEATTVAGITVKTLRTQAGDLPLIPTPFIPYTNLSAYGFPAPPSGYNNYFFAILTEDLIEMPYIASDGDPKPRLFQLGLLGNLVGQYVGVLYDSILAKGASYAQSIVAVQRP